ncbi:MAG: hypothetical protein IPN20_19390 [Haliscomenobacter sp.]|nr:hypothetical protein [Haliscomenobacter sp.]
MNWWNPAQRRLFWIKLFNWEYWPTMAFYWPMFLYGPLLALRYRHVCFFSAANPGMYLSGLGLESKFDTLKMIPERVRPKSVLVPHGSPLSEIKDWLAEAGMGFPMIAKPDLGYRGLLVTRIPSEEDLVAFLRSYPIDFILQEFLDYPEEVGVFYCRMPGQEQGDIISLTLKKFLSVTGDGRSTVLDLVNQNPRALLQMDRLQKTHSQVLQRIPNQGEQVPLGIIGNHSKGTLFINGTPLADERLARVFDEVTKPMAGFYYGRFDIKCQSLDLLKEGKAFKVIELNGIGSEPTHIYDQTRMTYPEALWTILRHWTLVAKVSSTNHAAGIPYMPAAQVLRALAGLKAYHRKLKPHLK